jgi:hypothetical protein
MGKAMLGNKESSSQNYDAKRITIKPITSQDKGIENISLPSIEYPLNL